MKAVDTERRQQEREETQNAARGYRERECPTGEEMNNIIKFWFKFISENFGEYNRILETRVKRMEKLIAIAALAATNAAIVMLVIKVKFLSRNQ